MMTLCRKTEIETQVNILAETHSPPFIDNTDWQLEIQIKAAETSHAFWNALYMDSEIK